MNSASCRGSLAVQGGAASAAASASASASSAASAAASAASSAGPGCALTPQLARSLFEKPVTATAQLTVDQAWVAWN